MDKKKKRKHIEYGRYGYFFIAPSSLHIVCFSYGRYLIHFTIVH